MRPMTARAALMPASPPALPLGSAGAGGRAVVIIIAAATAVAVAVDGRQFPLRLQGGQGKGAANLVAGAAYQRLLVGYRRRRAGSYRSLPVGMVELGAGGHQRHGEQAPVRRREHRHCQAQVFPRQTDPAAGRESAGRKSGRRESVGYKSVRYKSVRRQPVCRRLSPASRNRRPQSSANPPASPRPPEPPDGMSLPFRAGPARHPGRTPVRHSVRCSVLDCSLDRFGLPGNGREGTG